MTRTVFLSAEQRRSLGRHFDGTVDEDDVLEQQQQRERARENPAGVVGGSRLAAMAGMAPDKYSAASARHILWVLCKKAEARSLDLGKVFRSFDSNLVGMLSQREFSSACAYLGVDLSLHDVQNVLTFLGGVKDAPLYYTNVDWGKPEQIGARPMTRSRPTSAPAPSAAAPVRGSARDLRDIYRLPRSDILCQIANKIEQRRGRFSVLRTFRTMDSDRDGFVSKGEFDRGLQEVGFHLDTATLESLFSRFDPDRSGTIDYTSFVRAIDPSCANPRPKAADDGVLVTIEYRKRKIPGKTSTQGEIENPYGIVANASDMIKENNAYIVPKNDFLWQLAMKAEARGTNGNFVRNMFRKIDANCSGTISKPEFRRGLKVVFGLDIADADFDALMARFDPMGSGFVNYVEFARLINPAHYAGQSTGSAITADEKQAIKDHKPPKVLKKIAEKAAMKRNGLRMAFRGFDDNHDCLIGTKEFRQVLYDILNIELYDDEFESLVDIFDPQGTGKIDHNEFALCIANYDFRTNKIKMHEHWQPSPVTTFRRENPRKGASKKASEFLWQLAMKMNAKKKSTREIFMKYDFNHDGKITFEEVRARIEALGWQLKPAVLQEVFNELDVNGTGEIDYVELAKLVETEDMARNRLEIRELTSRVKAASIVPQKTQHGIILAVQKNDLVYRLSQKIEEKIGFSAAPRIFASCKSHQDGYVNEEDFKTAVMRLGWALSDEDYAELCATIDIVKDGMVDYNDFLEILRMVELRYNTLTPINPRGSQLIMEEEEETRKEDEEAARLKLLQDDVLARVAELWPEPFSFASMKHFLYFDPRRDGILSSTQFRMALRTVGCHLSDFEFTNLMKRLGFEDDEAFKYDIFLKAVEEVQKRTA